MTVRLDALLADLREEHRNTSIMLDLLEREIDRLRTNENADFRLMQDIMRYMTVYSDATHHPNEDVLYATMKARDPKLAEGLDRVEPEHEEIADLGQKLSQDLESANASASEYRDRLIAATDAYIRRLRQHMAWEEGDLFLRADALIQEERSIATGAGDAKAQDPVFGDKPDRSFARLLQELSEKSGSRE